MTADPPREATRRARVLVFAPYFQPGTRGGGPIRSIARMVNDAGNRFDIRIVCRDHDLGAQEPYEGLSGRWVDHPGSRVFYLNTHSFTHWGRLIRDMRSFSPDLVYLNSFFDAGLSILPLVTIRLRLLPAKQVVVAPRGELSPGALAFKLAKKRMWLWASKLFLHPTNTILHATSQLEQREIAQILPGLPALVAEETSWLPREPRLPKAPSKVARFVFISRISRKKQLHLVLDALRLSGAVCSFDIYGPVEDVDYWKTCQELIDSIPASVKVTYRGELAHEQVVDAFASGDAFLFPTLGENFGHVIAESLYAGCPVITSDTTPWSDLLRRGGGSVIDPMTAVTLANEISRWSALTIRQRSERRQLSCDAYRTWRAGEFPIILDLLERGRGFDS